MKKLPTDLQILNAIYERYYEIFARYEPGDESRLTKDYVPIDVEAIAKDLRVDSDIVFGRLYYHLNKKHGYRAEVGGHVPFFDLRTGPDEIHTVHLSLLASVLADLRDRAKKYKTATWIASASLVVSVLAISISILGKGCVSFITSEEVGPAGAPQQIKPEKVMQDV